MLKRSAILALIVAVAGLAFSAGASAEVATEEEAGTTAANPYTSPLGLVVRSSNGYWLTVNSAAKGKKVKVEASGADGSVTYTVPGTISETEIHADLGKYGQIDMHWVPDGQVREVRLKCNYKGVIKHFYDTGAYEGTLQFRGGDDFTSVDTERVAWSRTWYHALYACGFSLGTAEPGAGVVINAGRRGHFKTPVHFTLYRDHVGAKVQYSAHFDQEKGRVKIAREAFADGRTHSLKFTVANGATRATISPPAPFYGGATFEGAATLEHTNGSKGTLTGELGVEFPDGTKAGLAGEGFEAELREESIDVHPG
jgi:hypothetical protein